MSENLVEIEGDIFRVVKDGRKKRLVPVRVRANLNPLNVAAAAGLALVGALAATVAWQGLKLPTPFGEIVFFPGMKDTTFGADLNRAYERFMIKRRIEASGGEVVDSVVGLTQAEKDAALIENIGDATCLLLNREWNAAKRDRRPDDAAEFLRQAREGGCPWAKGR